MHIYYDTDNTYTNTFWVDSVSSASDEVEGKY